MREDRKEKKEGNRKMREQVGRKQNEIQTELKTEGRKDKQEVKDRSCTVNGRQKDSAQRKWRVRRGG